MARFTLHVLLALGILTIAAADPTSTGPPTQSESTSATQSSTLTTATVSSVTTLAPGSPPTQVAVVEEPEVDFSGQRWVGNPLVAGNVRAYQDLRLDVEDFGCEINLCFVLDGTLEITQQQFSDEKNFADLIVAITTTDDAANYCAIQYNDFFTKISPRTPNQLKFLKRLQKSRKQPYRSSGRINVDRGFRWVVNQLLDRGKVANKIVFFSKGGRKFGRGPKQVSRYFRKRKGGICGVVVGEGTPDFLLKGISPGLVVNFDGFFDLSEVVVSIVTDLCEMPCGNGARSC